MTSRRLRKAIVLAVGLLFVLVAALGAAGPARAAQNAPSWSTGDQWVWTYSSGGTTYTIIDTVQEQTSLTLTSGTFSVWHVNESLTTTTSTSSATTWNALWFQVGTLAEAKATTPNTVTTWDPPMALAVFPLNQNSWSLQTTRVRTIFGFTNTATITYTGTALAETSVTVTAGTFTAAPVQTPASGTNYVLSYYSDAVGNFVEIVNYQNGAATQTVVLASYKYQSAAYGLFFIVLGAVLGALVIAAVVLYVLRRRPRYPTQYAQAQPMPPQVPPYQSPQQPPQGPPGM